jgi:hypothetical protein
MRNLPETDPATVPCLSSPVLHRIQSPCLQYKELSASFFFTYLPQVNILICQEIPLSGVACMYKDTYDSKVLIAIASPNDTLICTCYKYSLLCFASELTTPIKFFFKEQATLAFKMFIYAGCIAKQIKNVNKIRVLWRIFYKLFPVQWRGQHQLIVN